jgi:branched-chain amino acid transport system substrate-binding protein
MKTAFKTIIAASVLMFCLFGTALKADDTLKLGFAGALMGKNSTYGLSNLYGAEYAVGQINAKGGVLGLKVELVILDDDCRPDLAGDVANKLLTQNLNLIIGHSCSGATKAALSVYRNKAIVISGSSTEVSLTDSGQSPYFFRTSPRDDAQAPAQVNYLRKKGFKKIAILHDQGDFGQALAQMVKTLIESKPSGMEIVIFQGINSEEDSYDGIISLIAEKQADALIWSGYYPQAAKLAVGIRDKGLSTVIIGSEGLLNQSYISQAGTAAEGTVVSGVADRSNLREAQKAVEDHRSRHAEDIGPYFFSTSGAIEALMAAVENTGNSTDLAAIKKHLTEDTVETIMGPVRFDAKGDILGVKFQ